MLDDEDTGVPSDMLDDHLVHCADCAAWHDEAARITRLARLSPATAERDLTAVILAEVALPRPALWQRPAIRVRLRMVLLVVAVAQLSLGLSGLLMLVSANPTGVGTTWMDDHLGHEADAFNLAIGVVLLLVGLNPRRAAGQLPLLWTFVGVLAAVSALDITGGHVGWGRLLTHLPVVFGLLTTVGLSRGTPVPHDPWEHSIVVADESGSTPYGAIVPAAATQPDVLADPPLEHRPSQPPAAHRDAA